MIDTLMLQRDTFFYVIKQLLQYYFLTSFLIERIMFALKVVNMIKIDFLEYNLQHFLVFQDLVLH